jgi:hypothetical protein
MLPSARVGLATAVLIGTAFISDEALAYRGGGARVGGGGVRAAGVRGVLLASRVVAWPIVVQLIVVLLGAEDTIPIAERRLVLQR